MRSGRSVTYRCGAARESGEAACDAPSVPAADLEAAVLDLVSGYVGEAAGRLADHRAFRRGVERAAKGAERRPPKQVNHASAIALLQAQVGDDPDLDAELLERIRALKAKQREADAAAADAMPRLDQARVVREALKRAESFQTALAAVDTTARKATLRELVESLEVDTKRGRFRVRVARLTSAHKSSIRVTAR